MSSLDGGPCDDLWGTESLKTMFGILSNIVEVCATGKATIVLKADFLHDIGPGEPDW